MERTLSKIALRTMGVSPWVYTDRGNIGCPALPPHTGISRNYLGLLIVRMTGSVEK